MNDVFGKIKRGELTPDQAVEQYECAATHISDIQLDLHSAPLRCGFPSIEEHEYLREHRPDLVILAARPGIGKTSLGCQLALNVSAHSNVLLYSSEMDKRQLAERLISVVSEKPMKKLCLEVNKGVVKKAREDFKNYKLCIDDTNSINIDELYNRTVDYNKHRPLSLIVVDYLQILSTTEYGSKKDTVFSIVQKLSKLAKAIDCPIVALAQLNRAYETRLADNPKAEPLMSDIADSSGIEKGSDMVLVLSREAETQMNIHVLKNRHGPSKHFKLGFSGELTKFFDRGVKE